MTRRATAVRRPDQGRTAREADHGGWRPVPDPTALTTEQLLRELASLREILESRLDGMDLATELTAVEVTKNAASQAAETERMRADFDRRLLAQRELILSQIKNVSDVTGEKFFAVDTRFLERDTRTEQAAQESRISLDAALAAAKEAVSEQNKANAQAIAKSEVATKEKIDALGLLTSTGMRSLEDRLGEIKERIDRGEGQGAGRQETRTEGRLDRGSVLALLAVLVAVASVVTAIALHR